MTRHVRISILAMVLAATGCAGNVTAEPGSVTAVDTSTTAAPQPTATSDPGTSATEVAAAPEQVGPTTTSTTTQPLPTTTEAPVPEKPLIADIETGDLDILVDELSATLGDLEKSLNEEEGDVFDD